MAILLEKVAPLTMRLSAYFYNSRLGVKGNNLLLVDKMSKKKKVRTFRYPKPDNVKIDESSFELRLRDFENYLKSRFTWEDFFILIPAWFVLLNAQFSGFLFFSGQDIKAFYLALMSLGTFNLLRKKVPVINSILNGKNNAYELIEEMKNTVQHKK